MKLIRKPADFPTSARGGALTIGNFDGVHRGHSRIIERLKSHAQAIGGPAVVFTFDPHPVRLLCPEKAPPPLTWTNRKADLLAELGVDVIFAFPTDEQMLSLSYQKFFDEIIVGVLGAKAMVEGPNFFFGRGREGNVDVLEGLCKTAQIALEIVQPIKDDGDYVSSSRIRDLVREGHVGPAGLQLTRPYRIRGMVTHGRARGAKLGFPTANLAAIDTLIPAHGVYAGQAFVGLRPHRAAIHIGPNPTFGEGVVKVEVHLLDFDQSIYGQTIEVDFLKRLRDIRPFASSDELKQQLKIDIRHTRQVAIAGRT